MWQPHHILTISRFPLAVGAIVLYDPDDPRKFCAFLLVVAVAAVSDYLDGKIARALDKQSEFGYIIDGLADRGFHIALIMVFSMRGYAPTLLAWLLIFRDVAIYALRLAHVDWYRRGSRLRPISIVHGYGLRIWAVSLITMDSIRSFTNIEIPFFALLQGLTVFAALIVSVSYYGLLQLAISAFSDFDKLQNADDRRNKS